MGLTETRTGARALDDPIAMRSAREVSAEPGTPNRIRPSGTGAIHGRQGPPIAILST